MTGESSVATASARISSFRDPAGALLTSDHGIFRRVSDQYAPVLREFLDSKTGRSLVDSGQLIGTRWISEDRFGVLSELIGEGDSIVEHDRVWFPSYAYEWPAEMLYAAGKLTIELAETALKESFGLKDATPYNVLFRGPNPVFVDVLSFEKREPGDATWLPYAQFLRMFILPLLMSKHFGVGGTEIFLSHTDGYQPEEVYRRCNWARRLRPPFLTTISVPTWLSKRADPASKSLYRPKQTDPEKAQFILETQFRRLGKLLRKAKPAANRDSVWSSYMQTLSYSDEDFGRKSEIVGRWLAKLNPKTALDIGCNTGHFSALAARAGARVVGIDADPAVVGSTWERAVSENLDILPLTVNLARPTPASGWRNAEYPSFLDRAAGAFDVVMMLAVVHHLIVTERIPLTEVFSLAGELTTGYVIVEYVSKEDPMFQRLTRGREALHADFTQESFERQCRQRFTIVEKQDLKGQLRCLYLLRKNER